MKPHTPTLTALLLSLAAAPGVEIVVTADPPEPVAAGDQVTIRLGVAGWNHADPEVDAVAFNVDFDPDVLAFVSGSGEVVGDGTEFLALPNQGQDYVLSDDSDESLVDYGRYIVGCTDIGDATAGSIGPDGSIGAFRLRAVAPGTVRVQATANSPSSVFSDTGYYGIDPTGGIDFGGVEIEVVGGAITYANWAATIEWESPGDRRPDADPEGDGRNNLLEYFFDADPLNADSQPAPKPLVVVAGGFEYLALAYERPAGFLARSDARDVGQRSADLETWHRDLVEHSVGPIDPSTNREPVVLRSPVPIAGEPRQQLRLLVELDSMIAPGP